MTQDYLIILIKNIQNASQTLDGSSNELYATGEEVQQGTQQIAATMEELASGTELQANSASNLANEMNSFAETTEETLRYGEEITVSSNQIVFWYNTRTRHRRFNYECNGIRRANYPSD